MNLRELITVSGMAESKDRFGPTYRIVTRTVSQEREGGTVGEQCPEMLLFENFVAD